MDKVFTWTVDVESDWGGRSSGTLGLQEGLPRILEVFRQNNIKALFFISTELMRYNNKDVQRIYDSGHTIGSHGHFHVKLATVARCVQDKEISDSILRGVFGASQPHYRAPKFNPLVRDLGLPYSDPRGHVGILKKLWLKSYIPNDPIFYLHPFDVTPHSERAPDLFCKLWYSKPRRAYDLFSYLCRLYPGSNRLHETKPKT